MQLSEACRLYNAALQERRDALAFGWLPLATVGDRFGR
jgi:hypothetical protein